jgi:uncharacterized protein (DUF2141 family)
LNHNALVTIALMEIEEMSVFIRCVAHLSMGLVLLISVSIYASDATFVIPNDMTMCADGAKGPAALVSMTGFKDRRGEIRVQLYTDTDEDFLGRPSVIVAKGRLFKRIIVKTTPSGPVDVCMPLPGVGKYSMIVFHDRDADGDVQFTRDGAGLPGNPKLKFLRKPSVDQATFSAGEGITTLPITLNYLTSIFAAPRPVSNPVN